MVFHPPRNVADYPSRKDLCAACEADVRGALPFMLCMVVGIILLCIFPEIATWLPVALMGIAL